MDLLNSKFCCSTYFCSAYRTPLCKAKRGGLKDTYPDDILAPVLKVSLYLFLFMPVFSHIKLHSFLPTHLTEV